MNKQNNSYTQSKRKNPNNTGMIWCSQNVKGWGTTTHQEYYKEDPQVNLGGIILNLFVIIFLSVIILCIISSLDNWILYTLLGSPWAYFIATVGKKGKRKNDNQTRVFRKKV